LKPLLDSITHRRSGQEISRVRDTEMDADAVHQQNGLHPSVGVRKAEERYCGAAS
jgi:hypothetical protein